MESVGGCSEERTQWRVSVAVARRGPNGECRWLWQGEDPMESVGGCTVTCTKDSNAMVILPRYDIGRHVTFHRQYCFGLVFTCRY